MNNDCTTYSSCKCNNNFIDDQLTLEIKDIDDLAIPWIIDANKDSEKPMKFYRMEEDKNFNLFDTQWLWRDGGKHGKGSINVTQSLHHNWERYSLDNNKILYLAIAIYDFPYTQWVSAGKWSFDASLTLNGEKRWEKHAFGKSDIDNNSYGLKYYKIFKLIIDKNITPSQLDVEKNSCHKITLSETIEENIADYISMTIKENYNYECVEDIKRYDKSVKDGEPYDCKPYQEHNNKEKVVKPTTYIPDFLFALILTVATYCFYSDEYSVPLFIAFNVIFLLYFFLRFQLAGKVWELVLRKKHNKELDTLMVILGLLFTASLGAITSFDFDAHNISNSSLYRVIIFTLYITTNIVFLYILTVISTYTVNSLNANKPLMLTLVCFIGIGIFIQEVINFEQNYKKDVTKVEKISKRTIYESKK